jgi:uncharacterized ion transporter superfamily protein YfcC
MTTVVRDLLDKIDHRLRKYCGRPSPVKRLITVLVIIVVCTAVNVWFVYSSIYSIGKKDAEKEFMKLQHIEGIELPKKSKEIKEFKEFKENKKIKKINEYDEQQSGDE